MSIPCEKKCSKLGNFTRTDMVGNLENGSFTEFELRKLFRKFCRLLTGDRFSTPDVLYSKEEIIEIMIDNIYVCSVNILGLTYHVLYDCTLVYAREESKIPIDYSDDMNLLMVKLSDKIVEFYHSTPEKKMAKKLCLLFKILGIGSVYPGMPPSNNIVDSVKFILADVREFLSKDYRCSYFTSPKEFVDYVSDLINTI